MSISLSFRTEESIREELDRIAEAQDRNRNWLINEAIKNYLELHAWRLEQIKKGTADADAGRTISTEELRERINKRQVERTKKKSK